MGRFIAKMSVIAIVVVAVVFGVVLAAGAVTTSRPVLVVTTTTLPGVQAADSGSGRFHAAYLPAGFKLNSETDQDLPSKFINGQLNDGVNDLHMHSMEYRLYDKAEMRERANKNEDLGPGITVAIVRDPLAKIATPAAPPTMQLRGRSATVLENGIAVKWAEHNGLYIQVSGDRVSQNDVIAVARGLVEDR